MLNTKEPLISIGLPVYNGQKFIKEAIDSILAQTFTDFELIISDNGSTDNTENICRDFENKDVRIKFIRNEENKGAAWNFNYVFDESRGKYFKWGTHDDVLKPEYLDKCFNILEKNENVGLCIPKRIVIDENGNEIGRVSDKLHLIEKTASKRYHHYLKTFRYTTANAIAVLGLFRKDILKQTSLIGNYPANDTITLCEIALRSNIYEIDEYIFLSRKHSGMSYKANPTPDKIANFLDPNKKIKVQYPRWKLLYENFRSIKNSPIYLKEKLFCFISLLQWSVLRTKSLMVDIYFGIKQYFWIRKNYR